MSVNAAPSAAPAAATVSGDAGQPGAAVQPSSPESSPASSPNSSEQAQRGPDYFREAFNRVRGYRQTTDQAARNQQSPAPQASPAQPTSRPEQRTSGASAAATPAPGRERPQQAPPQTTPQPSRQGQEQSPTLTLTREQFSRSVQSEVDRILAKRDRDAQAQKAKEEEQYLRANDPFEYVKRLDAQEAEAQTRQERERETIGYLEQQLHHYDRGVLDVVMGALPEKVRTNLLKSVQADGIPGRSELTKQGLKALQSFWQTQGRESARAALMRDEKFVKEVLARYGGVRGEPDPTPSLPPSAGAPRQTDNQAVNTWMRTSAAAVRHTSGRGR